MVVVVIRWQTSIVLIQIITRLMKDRTTLRHMHTFSTDFEILFPFILQGE